MTQALDARVAGEGQFREIMENVNLIAVAIDLQGKLTYCNKFLLELTGWRREELIGCNWFEKVFVASAPVIAAFEQTLQGGKFPLHEESEICTRSGKHRQILWTNTFLRDASSAILGMVSVGEDLTMRERLEQCNRDQVEELARSEADGSRMLARAEQTSRALLNVLEDQGQAADALRVSEAQSRLAIEAAHMGTYDWEMTRDRITWSRRHEELWGYTPGEFGGSYAAFTRRVHLEDAAGINAEITRCISAHEPFTREYRVVWPNGSIHWVISTGQFEFDAAGAVTRMRGVVMETTERRRGERELREAHARLRALSHRILEIQEAERKHISRELHDDVAQALAAQLMQLHSAVKHAPPGMKSRLAECIVTVELTLGQVRAICMALRPPQLDDLGLIDALHAHLQRQGTLSGPVIHFHADALPVRPHPDVEITCFRLVQEALANINRHASARNAWVELRVADDAVDLTVRDDGTGFDIAEARERAIRVGRVGLIGMQERAALVGGRLKIDSAPGHGTKVCAVLPMNPAQPAAQLTLNAA